MEYNRLAKLVNYSKNSYDYLLANSEVVTLPYGVLDNIKILDDGTILHRYADTHRDEYGNEYNCVYHNNQIIGYVKHYRPLWI